MEGVDSSIPVGYFNRELLISLDRAIDKSAGCLEMIQAKGRSIKSAGDLGLGSEQQIKIAEVLSDYSVKLSKQALTISRLAAYMKDVVVQESSKEDKAHA